MRLLSHHSAIKAPKKSILVGNHTQSFSTSNLVWIGNVWYKKTLCS